MHFQVFLEFSFSAPSTSLTTTTASSVPIVFGNSTSSTFNAKNSLNSFAAASTKATTASSDVTTENLNCLTTAPLFTFNSSNKPTTNETTVSSNVEVLPVSFKFDGSLTVTSNPFEKNANSITKTQPTNLSSTFSTDTKTQSCSSREQSNHTTVNQTGNEALQSNALTVFDSQCFGIKSGGSTAVFGNSSIPIFGSDSVKTGTQSIESRINNKSKESVTPKIYGSNTFTFGNKPPANAATNGNIPSTGCSFGEPAAIKSNEMSTNKSFSFGSLQPTQKQIQPVSTSNSNPVNIFGAVTKTVKPPAFNFNPGSSTNFQPNTSTVNNVFVPSFLNVTTGPSKLPIRRAIGRLQK